MPEDPNQEGTQETIQGWEDLTSQDDGRPDLGEPEAPPVEPEPTPVGRQEQPAATPVEVPPEPVIAETAPAAPTGEAAAPPAEGEGQPPAEPVYTLPGGKQISQAELAANPELLKQLVTHSNQLSHFQTLAEERQSALTASELERRRLLDQYTDWEMQQRTQQAQPEAPPAQRPDQKVLEGIYGGHLDAMVKEGRLSEDQRGEFGNVLSEYLFDHQNIHNLVGTLAQQGNQRIDALEARLVGEVVPDVQRRQQQDSLLLHQNVQQTVATKPGYEALAQPDEWQRLQTFIGEKVNASPRDHEGKPTFNPWFDADTMAQMYDAMTGAETRAALFALKAAQAAADKNTTALAGGETAARAGGPPIAQPSPLTPEQEAMDFTDPSMATG